MLVDALIVLFFLSALVRGRGWVELSVYPLFSPQSLIAEGSANFGIDMAFPSTERTAFERDSLFPLAGLNPAIAERFGLAYTVPEEHRAYYQSILVNIPFVNAGVTYKNATEAHWRLPLPGTFVVRQDGLVAFSEAHADFRVRPEPAEVLGVLRSL